MKLTLLAQDFKAYCFFADPFVAETVGSVDPLILSFPGTTTAASLGISNKI